MIETQDKALGYAVEVSRPGESGEFIVTRAKKFHAFLTEGQSGEASKFALYRAVFVQMRSSSLSMSQTPGELTEEVLKRANAFLRYFEA